MLHTVKLSIVLGLMILFANTAEAASLFFVPATGEFGVGNTLTVDLKIDSEGVGLNAAQATIRFPKDTLTVSSIDKTGSTFSFWLEEPTFSNEDGVISFVGGTPYGVSGASIQVIHIVFTTKGSGSAPLTIADSAITASDGSGTNILSKTNDAVFTISPTTTKPATPAPAVPAPKQITREPVPASGLPGKPVLTVPLYTDPTVWSNLSNIFTASWELPRDISGVKTTLNKQPNFTPAERSEGLFDNKAFSALSDGIWYLHMRFENSIGWGDTTHYRIAVDTQTPLPFEITPKESETSDNPTPTFVFKANDALSSIKEYRLKIDNEDWIVVSEKDFRGSYQLPHQNPGKHHLVVQAVDQAGNSIENSIDYETLPIASPTFTFVTDKLFSEEAKGLSVKGTALPSTEILLALKQGDTLITDSTVSVDANGNWEFTFSDPLRHGRYIASIQNMDARGALSLVVDSPEMQVTGKYTNIILISFIALAGVIIAGGFIYKRRRERTALRIDVAESDATKVFKMIEADVEKLNRARETATPVNTEFAIKKLEEDVKKMGGYVKEEIKRAKE